MKTTLICLPLLAIVLVAPRAGAQDAGARFGIGVSLNPSVVVAGDIESFFLPFGLGDVYVPIMIGERLKLEPQLGLFRFSSKFSDSGFTSESTFTVWRLGTGIFYRLPASESFSAYLGPRFELLLSSR